YIGAAMAERFLYVPAMAFAVAVVALGDRLPGEQGTKALLVTLLVLYAGRTMARNPPWEDKLRLSFPDAPPQPNNFRLHDMLAQALFAQDPRGNMDRTIAAQEASWRAIEALPPAHSYTLPATLLGQYYADKGDLVDPAEKRGWYEKSLTLLRKAEDI